MSEHFIRNNNCISDQFKLKILLNDFAFFK